MGTRERNRDRDRDKNSPATDPETRGSDGNESQERLDTLRASAAQLLNSADNAISRVLSSDSEQFLLATRQESGQ